LRPGELLAFDRAFALGRGQLGSRPERIVGLGGDAHRSILSGLAPAEDPEHSGETSRGDPDHELADRWARGQDESDRQGRPIGVQPSVVVVVVTRHEMPGHRLTIENRCYPKLRMFV
jgi:hypothetical protein